MNKKYFGAAEKKIQETQKLEDSIIINQRVTDEYFKNECKSREVSKSPTASFTNSRSSKWN